MQPGRRQSVVLVDSTLLATQKSRLSGVLRTFGSMEFCGVENRQIDDFWGISAKRNKF
jgi:hypothetical protein